MRMHWLGIALTCVICAALAACDSDRRKPLGAQQQSFDLEVLGEVPEFEFMERSGEPITRESMLGKVWVTTFIFTSCKTSCVMMSVEMNGLQEEFKQAPDFRIVATTVDPENDTLEVLDKLGRTYSADPERWLFMRGEIDDVRKFANYGLKIAWKDDDPLLHSVYFVLIDRAGRIRGYYKQTDAERMTKLRADIETVLAEKAA